MIRSFAGQETDRIWQGEGSRKVLRQIQDRA
jgi:hypothetical protein